jgi:tetratricopeptide (TPR) repeat protein
MLFLLRGGWNEARTYFETVLDGLKQADFVQIEALAKGGLGVAEAHIGDPIHARALAEEGLHLFQDARIKGQISTLECFVGICCHASGDLENARLSMNRSLASAIENDEFYFKGRALIWEGRIEGKLSDEAPLEAQRRIEDGLETLTKLETNPDISIGHLFLGEQYAMRNQEDAAKTHLKAAEAMFREMGMDYWIEETVKIMNRFE